MSKRLDGLPPGRYAEATAMSDGFGVRRADGGGTDDPATAAVDALNALALYWSIRGEVACPAHVPPFRSERWSRERWAEVPPAVRTRHGIGYQCQHCAESKTPIVHRRLNADVDR
jgi:hypothetical protein